MTSQTTTRPTIEITLSSYVARDRSYDIASYAEDGIDIADVDALYVYDVQRAVAAAYPECDVEVKTAQTLVDYTLDGDAAFDDEYVGHVIDSVEHGDQMDTETLRRRIAEMKAAA